MPAFRAKRGASRVSFVKTRHISGTFLGPFIWTLDSSNDSHSPWLFLEHDRSFPHPDTVSTESLLSESSAAAAVARTFERPGNLRARVLDGLRRRRRDLSLTALGLESARVGFRAVGRRHSGDSRFRF